MYIGVPVYINTIVRIYPIFFFPEFAYRGEGKKKRKREEPRWNKGRSFENGMERNRGNDNSTAYSKSNFRMITWNICCDT